MSTKDRQAKIVEAVEASLHDVTAQFLEGPLLDTALQVWHDFTDAADVSRTRKPEPRAAPRSTGGSTSAVNWTVLPPWTRSPMRRSDEGNSS